MRPLLNRLAKRALCEIKLSALALPVFAGGDLMYRWATRRLRRKPLKIFGWVVLLGALCWCIQYCGDRWAVPRLQSLLNQFYPTTLGSLAMEPYVPPAARLIGYSIIAAASGGVALFAWSRLSGRRRTRLIALGAIASAAAILILLWRRSGAAHVQDWFDALPPAFFLRVFENSIGALFSSLNILSCLSLVIIARTLRRLDSEGHIEHLMLAPGRFRPSALFYAIALRYIPLAFAAILVIYLNDERTPFKHFPFGRAPLGVTSAMEDPKAYSILLDPRILRWAAIHELSVALFCPANLLMDLAIGFWIYMRWRPSFMAIAMAIVFVGLVEPPIIMAIKDLVARYYDRHAMEVFRERWTPEKVKLSLHYLLNAALSLGVTWALLRNLDARWGRVLDDPKQDPVFLKS